ncbi:MAG TPA: SPFH domain-containing protein [Promineifilum sp.]
MTAGTPARRPMASPASTRTGTGFNWPWFLLFALFIAYWLFVHAWERVDVTVFLASILLPNLTPAQAATVPFPPWLVFLAEMFHPRVLRHFIPVLVGWWLAVQAAISLMQVLYDCPDRKTAAEFLRRQRRSRPSGMEEPYTVMPQSLDEDRERSVLLRVGGPFRIHIRNGFAAVTESNARFLRVLPPGVHDLGRFEYLMSVVDIQPQEKSAKDVSMLTQEGIPVKADVGLSFQIDPGENVMSRKQPYPFNPDAVRKAAYSGSVGASGKASPWVEAPLGKAIGALSGLVSKTSLDELLAAEAPRDAHHLIREAVVRKVWDSLPDEGIKPLRLQIGRLTPPPEATKQYADYWLAKRRKEDTLAIANGRAPLIHEAESARAGAELSMLQAFVQGIRDAKQESGPSLAGYLMALRMLEALQKMFEQSTESLKSVGGDTIELQEEITALDDKLADLGNQVKLPPPAFKPSRPD